MTKPVKISFNIPAKLRSRVIGQGGKTLKPIIQANEVKIEIGDQVEGEDTGDDGTEEDEDEEEDILLKLFKLPLMVMLKVLNVPKTLSWPLSKRKQRICLLKFLSMKPLNHLLAKN